MPLLTHPTEWPEATKRGLTHKLGPLPVWAWGVVIVGGIVVVRMIGKGGGTSAHKTPTGDTLLPGSAGGYSYGGGGGSGGSADSGGGGFTGSDTTAPSTGNGVSPGGIIGGAPGSALPFSSVAPYDPNNLHNSAGERIYNPLATMVGPITWPSTPLSPEQVQYATQHDVPLADWTLYQLSQGVKNPLMYGENAGPEQKALDAAALKEATARYAAGERYAQTPGYVNGIYVGVH